jgi:hypothetical protein
MSQTPLVTGIVLGGVVISAIGAASSQFIEEKQPTVKSLSRDFIIGAVMVAMIMQLLPESSSSVVQFVLSMAPLSLFTKSNAVVETITELVTPVEQEEVRVGVPKF